jgi:N-acetylglucosamine-6-phosphate deacetylase
MRLCIRCDTIVTPDRTLDHTAILVENGRITALEDLRQVADCPPETQVLRASGLLVLPGLIDLHVHGGAGSDTMDATPATLEHMSTFFATHGVTSFLPTTLTASPQAITRAIETIAACASNLPGAQALGVHLEGPYLSHAQRGAQPVEWLRRPDPAEYRPWLEAGVVRRVTLAPELPGALDLIREGAAQGVRFSAGHTEADYDLFEQAVEAGLSQSTHTFNGMTGLHHRQPGAAGAALSDDQVTCEAIADGIHLHPAMLKLLVRAKGVERTLLVTDAMRAAGLADGDYDLGGQQIRVQGGVARTPAGGLAGSTLTLERAVHNCMQFCGLNISQALAMATTTPAVALGLVGRKGAIQPGADADLIFIDPDWHIKAVMVGGKIVYQTLPL